ncbi:MAG: TIGR00730 family Rossman fold protein [Chthoniobacterales bacterium]
MKSICVYCGANEGSSPIYAKAAEACGATLAGREISLVFGGGNIGLMGRIADAVLAAKGKVIGVIPQSLVDRELAHRGVTELIIVNSMHERKQCMTDLADGFIALPGGIGTLEELTEVFTWLQLGFHHKPIGLLNVEGYYDPLLELLKHMEGAGFLHDIHREMLFVSDDTATLLDAMEDFERPQEDKWPSSRTQS